MSRYKVTIFTILIYFLISNVYGDYVVDISNNYRKADEPEWVNKIRIGMPKNELIAVLDENYVMYNIIKTTLDGEVKRAEREKIVSICIDLMRGGLERYPRDYMLAIEVYEQYTGTRIQKRELSHSVYLPFCITSTFVFGFVAWDNFVQASDLTDVISVFRELGLSQEDVKELREIRTRKRLIAWSSLAAAATGTVVSIKVVKGLKVTATPQDVKLTYNF